MADSINACCSCGGDKKSYGSVASQLMAAMSAVGHETVIQVQPTRAGCRRQSRKHLSESISLIDPNWK